MRRRIPRRRHRYRRGRPERPRGDIKQLGHEIFTLRADVTREDEVAQAIALVERDCGGVDVLVNNAGGGITTAPLLSVSLADFEATLRLNLTSQFLCIRAVLDGMMARRRGRIINITSGSFFTGTTAALFREPLSNMVPYVASKGGVIGLTRALAREVGPWNIAVNAVAPGFYDDRRDRGCLISRPAIERVVQAQAFARPQQADDASGAVVFLAGPGAAFITGQVIHVDGGWTTS